MSQAEQIIHFDRMRKWFRRMLRKKVVGGDSENIFEPAIPPQTEK